MLAEHTTMDLEEAAKFLGFKNKEGLRVKAHKGEIPGAKMGREWRFYMPDLIALMRSNYIQPDENESLTRSNKKWQSARRKTVLTTIRDSRSAASECKNLLARLRNEKQRSTKRNVSEK